MFFCAAKKKSSSLVRRKRSLNKHRTEVEMMQLRWVQKKELVSTHLPQNNMRRRKNIWKNAVENNLWSPRILIKLYAHFIYSGISRFVFFFINLMKNSTKRRERKNGKPNRRKFIIICCMAKIEATLFVYGAIVYNVFQFHLHLYLSVFLSCYFIVLSCC